MSKYSEPSQSDLPENAPMSLPSACPWLNDSIQWQWKCQWETALHVELCSEHPQNTRSAARHLWRSWHLTWSHKKPWFFVLSLQPSLKHQLQHQTMSLVWHPNGTITSTAIVQIPTILKIKTKINTFNDAHLSSFLFLWRQYNHFLGDELHR